MAIACVSGRAFGDPGRTGMKTTSLIPLLLLLCTSPVFAQTTQPSVAISTDVEDGKKMVHALVLLNGKPLENVTLQYFVQRTFQNLKIGEDTTLDDGTSAVLFPSDLPGSPDGTLHLTVRITKPAEFAATTASAVFPADQMAPQAAEEFPRAFWAPHAPWPLMLIIAGLLIGVWGSYIFVVIRIFSIRADGKS